MRYCIKEFGKSDYFWCESKKAWSTSKLGVVDSYHYLEAQLIRLIIYIMSKQKTELISLRK